MIRKLLLVAGAFCAATITGSAWADGHEFITDPPRDCFLDATQPRDACKPDGESPQPGRNPQEYPVQMDTGRCNANVCRITVKAVGPCKITVSPEFTFISGQGVRILWELQAAGNFAFDEQRGIEFKAQYNPTYPTQFVAGMRVDPKTWQYVDINSQPGTFRYNINVYNTRTGQTCSLDPGLVNDWP